MSSKPYARRMTDFDNLRGVTNNSLTDEQRAYWAGLYEALRVACVAQKVRRSDAVSVLSELVGATSPVTGLVDQSLSQLGVKCDLNEATVKRCLAAITQAGLVEAVKRGGGPAKAGSTQRQATVRRVTFLTDSNAEPPVDTDRTERTEGANSAHLNANSAHLSAPHYAVSTPTPLRVSASSNARPTTGQGSGGIREAQKGNDSTTWQVRLIDHLATAIYNHEASKGLAAQVNNPGAVIRTRKRPLAEAWVTGVLLTRGDAADFLYLPPDDPDLITWGVGEALGEQAYGAAGAACRKAHEAADAARRKAG